MKFRSIYTVTLNTSIDYIVKAKEFNVGLINKTTNELVYPGGKGINVSIVLNNLGLESTILGFEAGFTGSEIKRLVNNIGCHEKLIHLESGMSRINVKIEAQDETALNGLGPFVSEEDLKKLLMVLDDLKKDDVLILSGSVPRGVSKSVYKEITKAAVKKGVYVVVDASKDLLLDAVPERPFLIKPNDEELGELFGVSIANKQDAITYAKKLVEMGAMNVIVSMGSKGAVMVTADQTAYEMSAPQGTLINSVGAGDSVVAGFIYGLSLEKSIEEAFKYAVCAGSASAFSEELARKDEVEALYFKL